MSNPVSNIGQASSSQSAADVDSQQDLHDQTKLAASGLLLLANAQSQDVVVQKTQRIQEQANHHLKSAKWPPKHVAKLIRLKVEDPNRKYRELISEFGNRYSEIQICNRISFLFGKYRTDHKALEKYVDKVELTTSQLEKFIEMIPKTGDSKKKVIWPPEDVAKLIRLKATITSNSHQELISEFENRYSKRQISVKIQNLFRAQRRKSSALKKYLNKEGVTSAHIKRFVEKSSEIDGPKQSKKWPIEDVAKLIRLRVDFPNKTCQEMVSEFKNMYPERQINYLLQTLYKAYQRDNKALEMYQGKEQLTEDYLKRFVEQIPDGDRPKQSKKWLTENVAKLIRLKVELPGNTCLEMVSEFGGLYSERQIIHRLWVLYRAHRNNSEALEKYQGKAGLTAEHLKKFIERIPKPSDSKKKVTWSDEDVAKLIRLRAENPKRARRELVSEFNHQFNVEHINHQITHLYSKCRTDHKALEKYKGKAGLTAEHLKKFIGNIPNRSVSKKNVYWPIEATAKLIRLRAENPQKKHRELVSELGYPFNVTQLNNHVSNLYSAYRKNNKSLEKYVGYESLTEELLKKFIEEMPNKNVSKQKVTWFDEDVAKLIRLKVENPKRKYQTLIPEFGNRFDKTQITCRLASLFKAYKNDHEALKKFQGKEGLTEDLLNKFIDLIQKKTRLKNKTIQR